MFSLIIFLMVLVITHLALAAPAAAYLDPGSGSYLVQIIIASIAGAGLVFRSELGKIKDLIFKTKRTNQPDKDEKRD